MALRHLQANLITEATHVQHVGGGGGGAGEGGG